MGLTIIKTDARGAYRMIAEHDLYLDESSTKIIVVKQGEEVPKEATTVLAGKGGTIPAKYAEMLKALDAPGEVKAEVKDKAEEVKVEGEVEPPAPDTEAKSKPEPKAAKPKPVEEKPAG